MQYGLGIDLGTTQTAAAVRVDGRVEIVRLGGRRAEIPSLVFVQPDGSLLIGEAAERRGQADPGRLAREFKRRIGDPVPILAGGVPFSAHALTAKLLRHVLDTVGRLQDGPPTVLTVTHPANWGPYKREQLDQALRLADTGPVLLRTEPEAAALQHATARRIGPGETVAVYDLGGGTFDAAVLRREGEGFLLLGDPEGIEQLGGADFDEAVFAHVIDMLGDRVAGLDPNDGEVVTALARLRRDCVEAKEALSFDTEVMIPVALPGVHTRVRLNRSELESMIAPALADTVTALHRALRGARIGPDEVDAVLLAGGSSRIPLVSQLLSAEFGRPVVADPHPEHSIAMGAAVSTALVTGGASPFAAAVSPPPAPQPTAALPTSLTPPQPRTAPETAGRAADIQPDPADGSATPDTNGKATTAQNPSAMDATGAMEATGAMSLPGATETAPPASRQPAPPPPRAAAATRVPTQAPGPAQAAPSASASSPAPQDATKTHGPARPSTPVAYQRGAASVPSASPGVQPAAPSPTRTFPQPPGPAGPTTRTFGTPPAPPRPEKRSNRLLILVGVVTLAVIAGTTVWVTLTMGDKKPVTTAQPAASPSVSAPPFPTDTMLIRVDTGGDARPGRKSGVFVMTPGQAGRTKIADTGNEVLPEWSPDRKRLALTKYESDGSTAIWVMDADGGNLRKVVEDVTEGRVAWASDGSKLAFMRKVGDTPQIFTVTIGETEAEQLTRESGVKDDPAWSPDGRTIAYWAYQGKQRQIFLLDVANPDEPGLQVTDGENGPGVDPAWSPDGRTIAYTRGTGRDISDIWLVGSDGENARPLTDHKDREMDPSWSPDGSWLAFTRGVLAKPKIVVARADGSLETTLTTGNRREGHPCWS